MDMLRILMSWILGEGNGSDPGNMDVWVVRLRGWLLDAWISKQKPSLADRRARQERVENVVVNYPEERYQVFSGGGEVLGNKKNSQWGATSQSCEYMGQAAAICPRPHATWCSCG
jgi:hypothetical protein